MINSSLADNNRPEHLRQRHKKTLYHGMNHGTGFYDDQIRDQPKDTLLKSMISTSPNVFT